MKKLFFMLLLFNNLLFGLNISDSVYIENQENNVFTDNNDLKSFGYDLFKGKFKDKLNTSFNNDYEINIGDILKISFWNNVLSKTITVTVDRKGKIFIEDFGVIDLLGVKNKDINIIISKFLKNIDKSINSYSTLTSVQKINLFISGAILKAGLYEGNSGDSILKYIDKAGGIKTNGSFRNIEIIRNNKIIKKIDLYDFLLTGYIESFLFKPNDVIFIPPTNKIIFAEGEIYREESFELKNNNLNLYNFLTQYALIKPLSTDVFIKRKIKKENIYFEIKLNNIKKLKKFLLKSGDYIFVQNISYSNKIILNLKGEIIRNKNIIMNKGSTLLNLLQKIQVTNLSDKDNLTIFRKSVAIKQKKIINLQLDNLEKELYSQDYISTSQAKIKTLELESVKSFIKKARNIKTKGLIVLNKKNYKNFILEDGDTLYIPKKNNLVTIEGQVQFPNTQMWNKNYTIKDYILHSGDFTDFANVNKILILHLNGTAENYDDNSLFQSKINIKKGDSIIVMKKVPNNNFSIFKDATSIFYQIAVSAGVLITIF